LIWNEQKFEKKKDKKQEKNEKKMAAVLCGGIGKVLSGCCECIGTVCTAPFKLCGACCEGFSRCCGESCKLVTNCCSTSFCCYITVACILNLPPILLGLMDIPNAASGCPGSLWLLVFSLICVVHIVAAFYMSVAIQRDTSILPPPPGQAHTMQENAEDGAGRLKNLFCYDMWMAGYILVVIGFVAWLLVGAGWLASGSMDGDGENESCGEISSTVMIAFAFGWSFLCFGTCGLCMSMCCSMFYKPPPSMPVRPPAPAPAPAAAAAAAAAAVPANDYQKPAAAASKTGKWPFGSSASASTNNNPTPVQPSAPVEPPVAQAVPIYDQDAGYKV